MEFIFKTGSFMLELFHDGLNKIIWHRMILSPMPGNKSCAVLDEYLEDPIPISVQMLLGERLLRNAVGTLRRLVS